MPNNMIFLMQNTLNNSSGTNNYFSGGEVYFAKGKGGNKSGHTNIRPVVSLADLEQKLAEAMAKSQAQYDACRRISDLQLAINVEIDKYELEIILERTTESSYCVCSVVNFVQGECVSMRKVAACKLCHDEYECSKITNNGSLDPGPGCMQGFPDSLPLSNDINIILPHPAWMITQGQGTCTDTPADTLNSRELKWRQAYINGLRLGLQNLYKEMRECNDAFSRLNEQVNRIKWEIFDLKFWDDWIDQGWGDGDGPSDGGDGYGGGVF